MKTQSTMLTISNKTDFLKTFKETWKKKNLLVEDKSKINPSG